jgi:hypothetical protein
MTFGSSSPAQAGDPVHTDIEAYVVPSQSLVVTRCPAFAGHDDEKRND